jgi:bifunctional non-homologous end joining protein LigD
MRRAPEGDGWLHEIKHDGYRLLAIAAGDDLKLIGRNGHDRTALFRLPFDRVLAAELSAMVLDGEIAVPDERGVTHVDLLSEALRLCRYDQLAYFGFRLLASRRPRPRPCPVEDRKALLRDVVGAAECPRFAAVDHISAVGCSCSQRCDRSEPRALSPQQPGANNPALEVTERCTESGLFSFSKSAGGAGRDASLARSAHN